MNNVVLYLIGFAGTGKLTIAKEIVKRTDFLLVDNHYTNNVIFNLIDSDGRSPLPRGVWENVFRVRSAVLDTIRDLSNPERSFVFTNELMEGARVDEEVYQGVREVAVSRGSTFVPVRLHIEAEELARRIVNPERTRLRKLTNPDRAMIVAHEEQVYIPKDDPYFDLEVTGLSASDAADRILLELDHRMAT